MSIRNHDAVRLAARLLILLALAGGTACADTGPTPETPATVKFGLDYYFGITNIGGSAVRSNDGMWAGASSSYPSSVSVQWARGEEQRLRVSFGMGDLCVGRDHAIKQPLEAYYQTPAGRGVLTVGKYYVPFAQQEWQYETKYGLMYELTSGPMRYQLSANYNFDCRTPNLYARAGRQCGAATTLGLSVAGGRGLSFNSSHDFALGADLSHEVGALRFTAEYMRATAAAGAFQFAFGKVAYTRAGDWEPFVAAYDWRDPADELGSFRSAVVGTAYHLTPQVTLEAAYARANGRHVYWLQSHTAF